MNNVYSKIKEEIISVFKELHRNPELGFSEFKTSEIICSFLKKYNIEYTDKIAKTGVLATIGKNAGKVLLIRADMDALPVEEKSDLEYSSKNCGVMHACGHDIHTSVALATAYMLKQIEDKIDGCVKIVFQPAEETTGGAEPMIKEGVMENPKVTAAIGGHVTPQLEVGKVWLKEGPLMASPDDFSVEFIGKSCHGAEPENGISPLMPAAEFALNIKDIVLSKITENNCVLSVCTLSGGNSVNVIPESAKILGTFRSFSENSRQTAAKAIENYANELAEKYGVKAEIKYNFLYPPLINNEEMTKKMRKILSENTGEENIINLQKPLMTGEDFSYFANEVPSVFLWYGCSDGVNCAPLHSNNFIADENTIEFAANIFFEFAKDYFEI